jgi:hypothetical protein
MSSPSRFSRRVWIAAAVVFAATMGTWLGTGAHRGWTRTSVEVMQHDEVTGIDYPVAQEKFIAGYEVLAGGIGLTLALAGVGYLLGRRATRGPTKS